MKSNIFFLLLSLLVIAGCKSPDKANIPATLSGIYPHLAYYNDEGSECGTGAVVPWAGSLWVISYGASNPYGSSDKLYQITPDLQQIIRTESVGGTMAARMIHKETNQLFIGAYAIDSKANVRVISLKEAPGRYTGYARHLFRPESKLYIATMEEGFYDVDANTLQTNTFYKDYTKWRPADWPSPSNHPEALLPGDHGKGLYSGQGVLIYSNNGETGKDALHKFNIESGSLCEWDGKEWKLVRRNQFVEVTGPGCIYGNPNPDTDPIWATGWDYKSVLLGVRDAEKGWSFFRLPKASHSYDGAHGWNTEWPRIRNIGADGSPDYLMTMHGMFWRFPGTFTADNTAGIRPRSAYLKVIGDFTRWNDRLVFGCDDSAQNEFMNKRKAKGGIEGPGQSNSNLWFTSLSMPDELGPATAEGAVWAKEKVKANEYSEPFLFNGWAKRTSWINNGGQQVVTFTFEVDAMGNNQWEKLKEVKVEPGKSAHISFSSNDKGEWIRVGVDKDTYTTVSFNYVTPDIRSRSADKMFAGLANVENDNSVGGLLYGLGDNRRVLGLLANTVTDGSVTETGYYEMNDKLELIHKKDPKTAEFIRTKFAIPQQAVTIDNASVLVVDDSGRKWRLPLGNRAYKPLTDKAQLRICREVATERDLFNCMGTFYELPAENADGYAKIRPISSHSFRINDYASYRGMLLMTGISPEEGKDNPHVIISDNQKAAIWVGVIDDLWKLGKPVGSGGPWKETEVKQGIPSDPYLIAFYDKKELLLSHQSKQDVTFTVEIDPTGNGDWLEYRVFTVKSGEKFVYQLPDDFEARWIRFIVNKDTEVTAWLEYK